jgi:hypothetical protein
LRKTKIYDFLKSLSRFSSQLEVPLQALIIQRLHLMIQSIVKDSISV